jgi:hypothetical protein
MAYPPRPLPAWQRYSALPSLGGREAGSWTTTHHTRPVRERAGSGRGPKAAWPDWARRNPRLLFRLSAVFLFRFAERTFLGSLFQEPPRITRRAPLGPPPG